MHSIADGKDLRPLEQVEPAAPLDDRQPLGRRPFEQQRPRDARQHPAIEVGMPGGYDVGPQRISWLGQLMTNWMGDDGFLRRLNVSVRRPNIFGDVSWCRASASIANQ